MNRTPLPPVLYLVARDYGALGIGSPDITASRDEAYDHFTCATDAGEPVGVWQITTVDGLPGSVTDVTDGFEREAQSVCIARGLDWPIVRRLEDNPAIKMAAE